MNSSIRKYKCIIVDDEQNAIDVIAHHLKDFPDYEIVESFQDGFSALNYLKVAQANLIFLDIQMAGISGIDILKILDTKPSVILTTAYRHYAPEAFEYEVVDYLLKPISRERLRKALLKFEKELTTIESPLNPEGIIIRADRKDTKVVFNNLLYLEAMGDYVRCHTKDQILTTKESLKSLQQRLPKILFKQIHRSYLVNLDHVQVRSAQTYTVAGVELPIGRSFRGRN